MNKLGLYIHIPFCLRKCHYCDFVSYPKMESSFDDYIEALLKEANLYESYLSSREIDTVFIGGGTPSLLSPAQINRLVSGLHAISNFSPSEFTIESNPETITKQKISAYKNIGINRLSIGLQSHDNDILRAIGRQHTFNDFLDTYSIASEHINNINVDTMFGLPGQSIDNFRETLRNLIELSPAHISSYALKLEQGTKLFKTFLGIDDETDRQMYHDAVDLLSSAGYKLYETSNFSKKSLECAHNLKYWTGQEYLGLGVAAHSYLDGNTRINNTDNLELYIESLKNNRTPIDKTLVLSDKELEKEYIMLRFRLSKGIDFDDFNSRFNIDFEDKYKIEISSAIKAGLIDQKSSGLCPTIKGFDLQNTLISMFL